MNSRYRNRLAGTTSPYLQQHADNPVDWWPWCPEALELARAENRPILLSIGYSACHWCHVMAHESFEDEATAAVMNELYVNIKVDREERPDLDKIYQTAHQLLARRPGGWPLTVFLSPPDQTPFFAGTYFPSQARHGLPSFTDLLRSVHRAFIEQRDAIDSQNREMQKALEAMVPRADPAGVQLERAPFGLALQQFRDSYDSDDGGFGPAPKFPHPSSLDWLLRQGQTGDRHAKEMALFTLQQMARGGMNDQLGGGFCRYSVDPQWMIPHFEKMLYDNGPLLAVYADAWLADQQRPLFAHVCRRTAEWLMREMQADEGGYYSSLDADSEGEEGRFYVWDRDEVRSLLTEPEYRIFAPRYGLDRPANFEGRWHLHTCMETQVLQERNGLGAREVRRLLASARDKLLGAREQRVRPGRDDKILTSWNALTIRGMARAGRILDEPDWIDSAARALRFLRAEMWRGGRLLATHKDGKSRLAAYLDDHAFLLDALLEMLQTRWRSADLGWAVELAELLLTHFEDPGHGGFYFTADDHEHLIQRPKAFADEATPSGNGIAAAALQRLGHLIGEPRYLMAAKRTLQSGWPEFSQTPYAHPSLLTALEEQLEPGATLILRGSETAMAAWRRTLNGSYRPGCSLYAIPGDTVDLPGPLADRTPRGDGPVAYLCQGLSCRAPMTALEELQAALDSHWNKSGSSAI